jgi:Protein of unknown function (DUF2934)
MSHRRHGHANETPVSHESAGKQQAKAAGNGAIGNPLSENEVRLRAYEKWERAGRPAGDGVEFWLEAKRELVQSK